jgi:MoaA/NifB/PqqE/SkfB family radical SAM enzyme
MKELSLHITDRCNFKCRFCVWGNTLIRDAETIPWLDLERFLRAHQSQGFERVNLHGGEPILRRDLFDLLALISELGYPEISLQTNGWALASRRYIEGLQDAGVTLFIISVHGHTPELHDSLSGAPGSLARAQTGMAHLADLGIPFNTNTVITRQNEPWLSSIVSLLADAGVAHINLSSLMPSGRVVGSGSEMMPSYSEISPAVRSGVSIARERGVSVSLEGFPFCIIPGIEEICRRRNLATGHQIKCLIRGAVWDNHDTFVEDNFKSKRQACNDCIWLERCGGVYTNYVEAIGWDEFQPVLNVA